MPPVKGGFLVDRQGFLYPVQALLLDHQTKIALDLVLMVDARHPSARILREAPPAGLALVPLGAALFPEPYIFRVATMGARPLFIVQHLPADLQNTFRSFRPDHILKFAHQLLSLIHISEPTRRTPISYAVFCLKKKKKQTQKYEIQ